jgi:cytochrome P450
MVTTYEPITRALCEGYVAGFGDRTTVDGAVEYAQRIPARVIGLILGVPESMTDTFVGWVRDVLEHAAYDTETGTKSAEALLHYFLDLVERRKAEPVDDLTSNLLAATTEAGTPLELRDVVGNLVLMLLAGIDTTWSAIGSALWHLAQHPEQRRQLRERPELWPQAIEELLRAYAPVTMARVALDDTEIAGCPVAKGERVWMSFSAANRDPAAFPDPDVVDFEREINRHVAFGSGIHRCAGSNLARMELRVALQVFLERYPEFSLDESDRTTWAGGQVRGPRHLPLVVG